MESKKRRLHIEEVKEHIIEYLRENGSANMSELYRAIGCSKQTIYDSVRSLEDEGKVKTRMVRNRRIVTLVESVPVYLKVLTAITVLCVFAHYIGQVTLQPDVTVNLDSGDGGVVYKPPQFTVATLFLLQILAGYWFAVITFKSEDLVETASAIKRKVKPIFDKIYRP